MKKRLLLTIVLFTFSFYGYGRQHSDIAAYKTEEPIVADGRLEEAIWQRIPPTGNFQLNFPNDTSAATENTEVMMAYDDQFVYIAAICHDQLGDQPSTITSLRRDFNWTLNECFAINIDPFQDGLNGFTFAVSPYGVMREGLISNGDNIDTSWDNKWQAGAKQYPNRWVAEMKIPLSTLRYKGGSKEWKVNFFRNNLKRNERAVWVGVPINFDFASLAFTGKLSFEEELAKPGLNVSLIPYVTGGVSKNHLEDTPNNWTGNAGFDAKVGVTPSLNLDLTFNPDFSQVEVDQQVTNLDRFEIFFPERRQFFVENSDLFSRFGFSRIRPFFSRRIGIGRDENTGLIVQNPILYGARLSGKVNKDWRIGVLDMQTSDVPSAGVVGQHYTVATFQRQVFSRSNIAGIFVNRSSPNAEGQDRYTRIAGLDYNIASKDNSWIGKVFYHQAFKPDGQSGQGAHAMYLGYRKRRGYIFWNHEWIGENYDINDIGFVQRTGIWRFEPFGGLNFYPKKGAIVQHQINAYLNLYKDLDFETLDRTLRLRYNANFRNTGNIEMGIRTDYVRLRNSFDPTRTGGQQLEAGSEYEYQQFFASYNSDVRKLLNFTLGGAVGSYFNGSRWNLSGSLNYRFQPFGSISLTADYNDIELPEGYNDASLLLLGLRTDLSFTKSIFFRGYFQYNRQLNNINFNARLQWRFKPVSDLFIVYTENRFAEVWGVKDRAIILKLSYWLNL